MRRYLPFLVPFALATLAMVPVGYVYSRDGRPLFEEPVYVPVTLEQADPTEPFIEISGMAHYPVVVRQEVPGNLLRSSKTVFMFPLLPPHAMDARAVRIVVRTEREPAQRVSYEYMKVKGKLGLATGHQVPFGTEELFGRKGYYFTGELLVIDADEVIEAPLPSASEPVPISPLKD